jgi:hypothetical protein
MNDNAIAVDPTPEGLVLFAPHRKVGRSNSGLTKLRVNPQVKSSIGGEVPRRLPIRVWETHAWTKTIVERKPRISAEKPRILRARRR